VAPASGSLAFRVLIANQRRISVKSPAGNQQWRQHKTICDLEYTVSGVSPSGGTKAGLYVKMSSNQLSSKPNQMTMTEKVSIRKKRDDGVSNDEMTK